MPGALSGYPRQYRKSIRRIMSEIGWDAECAMTMMYLVAALMDLRPEDSSVVEMILHDYGEQD